MSTQIRLFSKLLLILLLSSQFTHAMANTGKAFSIKGTAVINGSELTIADSIKEGDIIKTGANSSVKIIMKDRTVLDIGENTRFQISKYSYNKEKPAESRSSFSLLKGTFRYISGLIAKNRPQNVQISAGTATIGIRGSFDTISLVGNLLSVITSVGTATITSANGDQVFIAKNSTGTLDVSTGKSSVVTTTSPGPVAQAARDIAKNPDAASVKQALSNLSAAEAIVAMAALINNAAQYGVSDLVSLMGHAAAANPSMAVLLAYVASALNPDSSQSYINAIINAVKDQDDAIQNSGNLGTTLSTLLDTSGTGDGDIGGSVPVSDSGVGSGSGSGGGGAVSPPSTTPTTAP